MPRVDLFVGDCRELLKPAPENAVDAVVCDPPYGLGFMGKGWDHGVPGVEFWTEILRVAKPGANLFAFGGTRTFHRLATAIEDAGFEIRDCLSWLYGTGFPKSLNLGDGIGTALKPGWEPVIFARKPIPTTVAANVAAFGTGGINVDGCRLAVEGERPLIQSDRRSGNQVFGDGLQGSKNVGETSLGRWPANVVLDEEAAALLDAQSGDLGRSAGGRIGKKAQGSVANVPAGKYKAGDPGFGDSGGASRFFYCAKASRSEREAGLEALPKRSGADAVEREEGAAGTKSPRAGAGRTASTVANFHPTVKPIALMRWLVRLATPKGGIVLDPFMGSGSTGIAAKLEGFDFLGIDLDPDYVKIAEARIAHAGE